MLEKDIKGIRFRLDKGNLTAEVIKRKKTKGYEGDIIIPETVVLDEVTYCVTSIGEEAFLLCPSLTSITIPNSVTSIEKGAFLGCNLVSIVVAEGNPVYDSRENCNAIIETATNTLICGCQNTIIPNSVTSIGERAFKSLTSITIPNSVTSIEKGAFYGCNLVSIVVAEGNPVYDSRENCNAIIETATNTLICGCQNTIIFSSVTSIGERAFSGCSALTSITIPNRVTSIGNSAFAGCESLTSIIVEKGNTVYDSRENGNAIIETATNTLICGCQNTIIPNSVTSIGERAFSGCSSLTSVTIPNSVTSIGKRAFSGCTRLTSVTIPNSVTSIGDYAFSTCITLKTIAIPDSVTRIGVFAFMACLELADIRYGGTMAQWKEQGFDIDLRTSFTTKKVVHCTDGDVNKSLLSRVMALITKS